MYGCFEMIQKSFSNIFSVNLKVVIRVQRKRCATCLKKQYIRTL